MEFLTNNWEYVLVVFYCIEKIVLITPTKYDDMLFSMILKPLMNKIKGK